MNSFRSDSPGVLGMGLPDSWQGRRRPGVRPNLGTGPSFPTPGQVGHRRLPDRRTQPHRQPRHEARRARRDSRRFPADRNRDPGIRICEHLPRLAEQAGKLAIVRTLSHSQTNHLNGTHQLLTGHSQPGAFFDKIASRATTIPVTPRRSTRSALGATASQAGSCSRPI